MIVKTINEIHITSAKEQTWRCNVSILSLLLQLAAKLFEHLCAIFLGFHWKFLSFHVCYKQYKAWRSWLDKYLFHKNALNMSFLTGLISSARIILLPTVSILFGFLSTPVEKYKLPKLFTALLSMFRQQQNCSYTWDNTCDFSLVGFQRDLDLSFSCLL